MKLGLGAVQFGLDYGVSNNCGRPTMDEVRNILRRAGDEGVSVLDTASSYGDSESVLGATMEGGRFRIVTKTPVLRSYTGDGSFHDHISETLNRSLARLGVNKVYGLLVHHADDLGPGDPHRIWETLNTLKARGLVEKIGVSVYDADQIDAVLEQVQPDIVQLPVNIFDQRLIASGHLWRLSDKGIEIHARSVFLQGLLLMETGDVPTYFSPILSHIRDYHSWLNRNGLSKLEGALGYVKKIGYPDVALVGVNSVSELNDITKAWGRIEELPAGYEEFGIDDENYVNPARWKVH